MTMGNVYVFLGAAENRVTVSDRERSRTEYAAVNEGLIVYSLGIVVNA